MTSLTVNEDLNLSQRNQIEEEDEQSFSIRQSPNTQPDDYNSTNESHCSNIIETPNGSTLWKPVVQDEFKPIVDKNVTFENLDAAIAWYNKYAELAGFDTRKTTTKRFGDNTIKLQYVACNRCGEARKKCLDTIDKSCRTNKQRYSHCKVTNCKALVRIQRVGRTERFRYYYFEEAHNHPLYCQEEREHSKASRKMGYSEQEYIMRASTSKIGPSISHKFKVSLKGGHKYVTSNVSDYKNFRRDVSRIIGDKDAQMMVNKMNERKKYLHNFSFEFKCDDGVLSSMFWADETAKACYTEFCDVISFDATFRTNKYGLTFVPFNAIDNHQKSVTVGAGIITKESIDSYTWLLEAFLKSHGKQPKLALKDPALKQAIEKVSPHVLQNTDFKKRFNKLVWNSHIEPEVFEKEWELLIDEFNFEEKRWFRDMFNFRKSWIPAYFKDIPMSGLMKTTSRSESINSFFDKYSSNGNLLLNFMMNFDTAIQKQRQTQRELDLATKKAIHSFRTPQKIEQHACKVYTYNVFRDVQKEIYKAAWFCNILQIQTSNDIQLYTIVHKNKRKEVKSEYKVQLKLQEKEISCTCQHFIRFGVLCRHCFAVFLNQDIEEIPKKYILKRWTKDAISSYNISNRSYSTDKEDDQKRLINEAYSNFEDSLDIIRDDKDKLIEFVRNTKIALDILKKDYIPKDGVAQKIDTITKVLGVKITEEIQIENPEVQRNKGCRSKKRIIGESEKAVEISQKKNTTMHWM